MIKNIFYKSILLLFFSNIYCSTIEEKKINLIKEEKENSTHQLNNTNLEVKQLYASLEDEYQRGIELISSSCEKEQFEMVNERLNVLRDQIQAIETSWKENQTDKLSSDDKNSVIWELGDVTISKIVIEYGSHDSLYVIPPEVAKIKLSLHSLLSFPKESWPKMIDLILIHNNIGVKKINAFTKQLYLLKDSYTNIDLITSDINHTKVMEPTKRIIFIYSPPIEDIKTSYYLLDRFKNSKSTYIYQVGPKIAIVGLVSDINTLISLSENIWDQKDKRVSKIIPVRRINPDDAITLLKNYFGGLTDYSKPMISMKGGNGLSAFKLNNDNNLVIIGTSALVDKAEALIRKTESQINDPKEITLYWHTCSHCKPTELAEILSKVYESLNSCQIEGASNLQITPPVPSYNMRDDHDLSPIDDYPSRDSGYQSHNYDSKKTTHENFFPYTSNGSVLMVVKKDTLGKIKEIIKRLDTPKKMVEIEVLLCERRTSNSSKSGINLLKLGDNASNTNQQNFRYNGNEKNNNGIMEYIFRRKHDTKNNIPSIDLAYNFLLSQEDVVVTASPSTTTLNQVPTTLAITDQISINNGASSSDGKQKDLESYVREDFGITITLTPTIHEPEIDQEKDKLFITLENDISFETISNNAQNRPNVHKRHITNTVRIPDGETIIIGGLKQNAIEEKNEKIPLLGEIPGFAKIFGSDASSSKNSEMFIFIKPRIINDPSTNFIEAKEKDLRLRPGDNDIFLKKIYESKKKQESLRFSKSLKLLFTNGM